MRWIWIVLVFVVLLAACEDQTTVNTKKTEDEQSFRYNNISEYMLKESFEDVYKTDVLQISDGGDYLVYDMRIWISPSLLEKLRDTKGGFYITFQDIPGESLLQNQLKEELQTVDSEILLTGIDDEGYFVISQTAHLKDGIAAETRERLLDPASYSFAFYDEEKGETAVTIGLDISTLDE